jgi:hypothetical protein
MWTLVNMSYGVAMGHRPGSAAEPRPRSTKMASLNAIPCAARSTRRLLASLATVAFGLNLN